MLSLIAVLNQPTISISKHTQNCYTRSVRMPVDFYDKTSDLINELKIHDYLLYRKNVDKWSPTTMRICYGGIKLFFINVLKCEWHTLELIHARREHRLQTVLSLNEIRTILKKTIGVIILHTMHRSVNDDTTPLSPVTGFVRGLR